MGRSMKVVIVGLMAIIVASSIAECDATSRALSFIGGTNLGGGGDGGLDPLLGTIIGLLNGILGGAGGVVGGVGGVLSPPPPTA
ncbi:hypothetical protein C2S53_013866 [Perilla frutescens var. hirtella]|uniref:Uncharacterized protein n=1 Tax=Perilla frutescens var. hirtella TaxID=608512 RepID=A0AAD4P2V1_PERFH|nr:hypothetical protein C2S51_028088 [Perilla frutescens var. frutescens]KAH6824873.1 hypothetical protein C2S53_013866 [Perilla frutescens var. hirtella]